MAVTTFPLHDVSEVMEENAVRPGTKEGRASGSVTHVTTVASDSGDDVGVGRQLLEWKRSNRNDGIVARVDNEQWPSDVGHRGVDRSAFMILVHIPQTP